MKWVTREHPKTDRIACPWLIKNFIDADAEFLYVPAATCWRWPTARAPTPTTPRARATPTATGSARSKCWSTSIEISDPAVQLLARIVHGADVSEDRDATPQSPGLQAVAEGFHYLVPDDDHRQLALEWPVYDALYQWCKREAEAEPA